MAKKNTLTDLSDYLDQNPNEIDLGKTTTKEDFIKRKPNSLVEERPLMTVSGEIQPSNPLCLRSLPVSAVRRIYPCSVTLEMVT